MVTNNRPPCSTAIFGSDQIATWHTVGVCACVLSRVWLCATLWTAAHQAAPSMEFSRQECWSGLVFPTRGDLSDPGIEPASPASLPPSHLGKPYSRHNSRQFQRYLVVGWQQVEKQKSPTWLSVPFFFYGKDALPLCSMFKQLKASILVYSWETRWNNCS